MGSLRDAVVPMGFQQNNIATHYHPSRFALYPNRVKAFTVAVPVGFTPCLPVPAWMLAFRNFIFTLFLPGIHPQQLNSRGMTAKQETEIAEVDECVGGCTAAAAVRGRSRRVDKDYYAMMMMMRRPRYGGNFLFCRNQTREDQGN